MIGTCLEKGQLIAKFEQIWRSTNITSWKTSKQVKDQNMSFSERLEKRYFYTRNMVSLNQELH